MYNLERIENVLKKVFGEEEKRVYFNGTRAEGLSFIFTEVVESREANKLLQALNEEFNNEQPLSEWRVVRGSKQNVVTQEILDEDIADSFEVRFRKRNFYSKI